ncbi:MAG: hypothetical protein FWH06_05750, partial [Oscillospiraceae bacterium]|nr:hypothetical protein [Oscillospiraceae bacterium]
CSPEAKQLADGIEVTLSDRRLLRRAGAAARTYIHKPWGHIVERACRRYETVAKLYKSKQTELEYARTHSRVLNTPPVKLRRDTAQI